MLIPEKVAVFLVPCSDEQEIKYLLKACVFIDESIDSEDKLQTLLCDTTKALEGTYDMDSIIILIQDSKTLISHSYVVDIT